MGLVLKRAMNISWISTDSGPAQTYFGTFISVAPWRYDTLDPGTAGTEPPLIHRTSMVLEA